METNQEHDGANGQDSNQPEKEHDQNRRQREAYSREKLKEILTEIIHLTSFLQKEIHEAVVAQVEGADEFINKFQQMPDSKSIEVMESNMMEVIKLIPMAHAVGINFVTSLMASMAATIEANIISDLIQEINEESFNDD